jgi:hypothetical protein
MEWNIFKIIQLICWISSVTLIALALTHHYPITEKPEELVEMLGLFTVASVSVNEIYESRLRKFCAANVLAVGYIKNCIEPLVEGLLKKKENKLSASNPVHVLMPKSIDEVKAINIETMLDQSNLRKERITVNVNTRNRDVMDIAVLINDHNKRKYYFDVPNTLSSLQALVDYKLQKKANNGNEKEREKLERKLLDIFRLEMTKVLDKLKLNDHVKIIFAISELGK